MDSKMGTGTEVHDTAIIQGCTTIGSNNQICPYVVVGTAPQHLEYGKSNGCIVIGDDSTIREFTSIQQPIGELTSIGSRCYIMSHCDIGHDCTIHDDVVISTGVILAGHVSVHGHVTIGQGAEIHQYRVIGSYAMIGMGCPIVKDVPPFALINRGRFTKINRVGLERAGIDGRDIDGIHDAYSGGFEYKNDTWYEREIKLFLNKSKTTYTPDF